MKRVLAIIILTAATPAAAQDQGWIFRFDQAEITPADPIVWVELWAFFPATDYAFAGARLDLHASEEGWGEGSSPLMGIVDPPPTIAGPSVLDIVTGQLNFPPAGLYADPSNPIKAWRQKFEVTDFTPRDLSFHTETRVGAIFPERESRAYEERPWADASAVIRVVPAPGAVTLGLTWALLASPRRRRQGGSP
ncbi:MAG: hypothetical protein ACF8R7_17175 [Phycisphaerales bacterium JB039]